MFHKELKDIPLTIKIIKAFLKVNSTLDIFTLCVSLAEILIEEQNLVLLSEAVVGIPFFTILHKSSSILHVIFYNKQYVIVQFLNKA